MPSAGEAARARMQVEPATDAPARVADVAPRFTRSRRSRCVAAWRPPGAPRVVVGRGRFGGGMRRRRVSPAAAALLLAAAARCCGAADAPVSHKSSGSWGGQPVCDGGRWTEATAEELLTGKKEPNVQCAREPPCVRWSWVRSSRGG